jgi:type IV pilus assembly protein PilB
VARQRIGELLVSAQVLSQAQLDDALSRPRAEGERIGDVLCRLGLVTETVLTQTLSQQLSVPWVSLYHVDFSRQLLNLVPQELAEQHTLVPVFVRKSKKLGEVLYVATDDPTSDAALDAVKQFAGLPVRAMLASKSDIKAAIRVYYTGDAAPVPPPAPSGLLPHAAPPPASVAKPPLPKPPPPVKPPPAEEAIEDVEAVPDSEGEPPPVESKDSPSAAPVLEAREIEIPKPKQTPATPMIALTLLDGTTINLPAKRRGTASAPPGEVDPLTARDFVSALRAVSHGADAVDILGQEPRWEPVIAALLSLLLKKGLIADWEFIEEFRKI